MADSTQYEEEALGKAYDARLMRRMLQYLKPYRRRVALAIAFLLCASALEIVSPILTKIALDRAIPARDTGLIGTLAVIFLVSIIVAFVMEYAYTMLTTWIGQRVMYDMRRQIFAHFQRLDLSYYDRNPVGRSMTRITNDVEVLNELFSSGVVTVFGDIFTLVLIAVAMFVMDWKLALVTLTVIPLVFAAAALFRKRVRDSYREIRIRIARINAYLQERLSGMPVVQIFGREEATLDRFRAINNDHLEEQLKSVRYYALFFPVVELLTSVSLALIIVYGGWEILNGALTIGAMAAFFQFARRFFTPIQDLSEKYNMLQGAMASSERIFKLLDTPVEDPTTGTRTLPSPGRGEIEFRNVWFAYRTVNGNLEATPEDPWDWVLRGVSFRAHAGEKVAIVGHTGAGKTTVIGLLLRFYEPQRGEILFDGVLIRDVPRDELRRRISLVLQDVFIFSRDVEYNVRLGETDMPEERVRDASQRVGADRFIDALPAGLATPLGERGTSLSVGERQLLSFARALAFDPLVLVLDEATSSVDSALEERIEEAIETLMEGRTSIVIAHRLSTVQNADRILVFHHGELREQGTHAQLLARGGLYARLYELQFARAIPERSA